MSITPAGATAKTRRPVCTVLAACGPVLLLSLYFGLSSVRGTRLYDAYALRNYGTGLVAFGLLLVVTAGLVLAGVGFGVGAVLRRERPAWAARGILVVNGLILLAALSTIL